MKENGLFTSVHLLLTATPSIYNSWKMHNLGTSPSPSEHEHACIDFGSTTCVVLPTIVANTNNTPCISESTRHQAIPFPHPDLTHCHLCMEAYTNPPSLQESLPCETAVYHPTAVCIQPSARTGRDFSEHGCNGVCTFVARLNIPKYNNQMNVRLVLRMHSDSEATARCSATTVSR